LENFQINKDSWNNVKASFLLSFKPKHSMKSACSNLHDLNQKPGISKYVYCAQNIKMYKIFM
jgi:hypothetical protein